MLGILNNTVCQWKLFIYLKTALKEPRQGCKDLKTSVTKYKAT